ncbi:MAG: type II toxin-antitoxin system Phd/YefM family antitoxin [Acidobacteriota bacterium]
MAETVKPKEVRQRLGDLLDRISERREFVIERRGKPAAAMVSYEKYQRMQRAAETELLESLDRHARKLTEAQARELARSAKQRVRGH